VDKNCNFTLEHYRECLISFKTAGYKFLTFSEVGSSFLKKDKFFLCRHDVDHQLDLALNMARIEASLGIKSTYFLRTQARSYNLFSWPSVQVIHEIKDLGHELGYHYEFPLEKQEQNLRFFECTLNLLRSLFGDDTFHAICPHEPARVKTNKSVGEDLRKKLEITYDAYDPVLMEKFKYISDSSCHWREGCMHTYAKSSQNLYVLTHPVWWYNKNPGECY